ncbi:MAG TPA: tetratricopeptide repeat protein [Gemmataceae bacterium]|nr:tetratricopeptide repeat protein [Gemmataceae bacterium]
MSDLISNKYSRPFKRLLVGISVLIVIGVAVWRLWPCSPAGLPAIDLAHAEPAVRAAVEERINVVKKNPNSGVAWGELGIVLKNQTFVDEAQQCFARAEVLDPKDARWPHFQGVRLLQLDPPAALPKFQRAVELSKKETVGPRLRLAELLLQLGRFAEAKEQFRYLLNQYPKHPRASLGIARVELHAGELQNALDHSSAAVTHPLTRKSALMLSAEIHARQGNKSLAREEAAQSFNLPQEPNWPDHILKEGRKIGVGETFRWQQAQVVAGQNDPSATIALLEDLVADYPKSVSGIVLLGWTYMQHNKAKEAEECFKRALNVDPKNVNALVYLGMVRHAAQDRDGAMKRFREAIDVKPNSSIAYYNLAQCLKADGDLPGAIDALKKAVNCQPENAPAHAALGELLLADGQLDSAEFHLQEAVAVDSTQTAARKALVDLSIRRAKSAPLKNTNK